jgi:hypothetical protein
MSGILMLVLAWKQVTGASVPLSHSVVLQAGNRFNRPCVHAAE